MDDLELKVMTDVAAALQKLRDDPDALRRALSWINQKFLDAGAAKSSPPDTFARALTAAAGDHAKGTTGGKEIPSVARLTDTGRLIITARDLKARSANDAAVRLAHVAIWAYSRLTGQSSLSSKDILLPLLKEWRLYNGNTRTALKRQRGIIREGDSLSLDVHAMADAERFVEEIRDPNVQGTWSASRKTRAIGGRRGRHKGVGDDTQTGSGTSDEVPHRHT